MATLAVLAGGLIIAVILHDAFEVMLLPRRVGRRRRLTGLFYRVTWWGWAAVGRRIRRAGRREWFLAWYGPLSMILLPAGWSAGLVVGFALVQWGLAAPESDPTAFAEWLYFSGVTFFTLGYGDVTPTTPAARAAAIVEAGTGFGLIASVIGYLPTLYQLFSRREVHVAMLDERAGSPPCGTSLLTRHATGGALDELDNLLREWEAWSAELGESQLSYPMLGYYRSHHVNQSWLAAMTAILDACALVLVGLKGVRPFQARMTFAAARGALVGLGRTYSPGPAPPADDRLPAATFARVREALTDAGLPFDNPEYAEERLAALRASYEPLVLRVAGYLVQAVPTWLPPQQHRDNWLRGPGGDVARAALGDGLRTDDPT